MSMLVNSFLVAPSTPAAYARFSADYGHPSYTLTNGELTAEHTGILDTIVMTAPDGKTAGKWYFEVTIDLLVTGEMSVGVGNYKETLRNYLGNSANSIATTWDDRVILNNANQTSPPGTFTTGSVVCVAVDATNRKVWFRINGGSWSSASGDPTNSSTGHTFAGSEAIFPMLYTNYVTSKATANFGATSFAQAMPSGYSGWTRPTRTNHRYWRFHNLSVDNVAGANTHLAEVELRLTTGGADQTGSGTPTASSVFSSPTFTADKAVDNDINTLWHCSTGAGINAWWDYDFGAGSEKDIREILLTVRNDALRYPQEFRWIFSDDQTAWFPFYGLASEVFTQGQTKTYTATT